MQRRTPSTVAQGNYEMTLGVPGLEVGPIEDILRSKASLTYLRQILEFTSIMRMKSRGVEQEEKKKHQMLTVLDMMLVEHKSKEQKSEEWDEARRDGYAYKNSFSLTIQWVRSSCPATRKNGVCRQEMDEQDEEELYLAIEQLRGDPPQAAPFCSQGDLSNVQLLVERRPELFMGLRGEDMCTDWSMGSHGLQEEAPQLPSLVSGTGSLGPSLQSLPGLKVGTHQGPIPFHPGVFLPPATVHGSQAASTKDHLRASRKLSSAPPWRTPAHISTQSPEGAKAAGGWCVSAAMSMSKPSQAVTAPGLGPKSVPRLEPALGAGRGQAAGADTLEPAGAVGAFLGPAWSMVLPQAQLCLSCHPRTLPAAAAGESSDGEPGSGVAEAPGLRAGPTWLREGEGGAVSCLGDLEQNEDLAFQGHGKEGAGLASEWHLRSDRGGPPGKTLQYKNQGLKTSPRLTAGYKMRTTAKDSLNGFDQNADNNMDNEIHVDVVSDGDEELVGNWSKEHLDNKRKGHYPTHTPTTSCIENRNTDSVK
ncbi:hypothetical protein AAY473_035750 [Plecturocebus cupreus]